MGGGQKLLFLYKLQENSSAYSKMGKLKQIASSKSLFMCKL